MRTLRLLAIAIAAFSIQAQADNMIRVSAPITYVAPRTTVQQIEYGNWETTSQSCSAYTPAASSVAAGTSFTQTRSCTLEETRTATQWTYYQGTIEKFNPVVMSPENRERQQSESQTAIGAQAVETGCKYSTTSPAYSWDSKRSRKDNTLIWAGVTVFYRTGVVTAEPIDVGGFRYTRGDVKLDEGTNTSNIHRITAICRAQL